MQKALRVKCIVKERTGVWWSPGDVEGGEEAQAEVKVRLITPHTPVCLPHLAYGITWRLTQEGESDVAECPDGYKGQRGATRVCHTAICQQQQNCAPPVWQVPDFSGCVRRSLLHLQTTTLIVCAMSGCSARLAPDGHFHCSAHAPCATPSGFDPMACIVCAEWVGLLKEATPDARPKLPSFLSLKAALTRLRRVVKKRDGSSLVWADHSLGAELGLSRIQYPASGNSESQGVESLSRPIDLHPSLDSSDPLFRGFPPQAETSRSVARLPSVSSPLPGPSGVRPPTPQLVTSARHSRGRKRKTRTKASSHKKTHRRRRSPSSSVSSSSSSSSTSSSDQSSSPRRRRKPAKVSHPVSREDLSRTMSAMLSSLLPTLLSQFLPAPVSSPAPTPLGLPTPLPPVPHQASPAPCVASGSGLGGGGSGDVLPPLPPSPSPPMRGGEEDAGSCPPSPPLDSPNDVLLSLATVAEGAASMTTYNLQGLSRKFVDARIAARNAAAKTAPEMAQRGVIRACPLSPALFDQKATDAIFSSLPAVINIPKQTVQKQRPPQPPRPAFYTPLLLHERGFSSLPADLDGLVGAVWKLLKKGQPPLLPGEGASVLRTLWLVQKAKKRRRVVMGEDKSGRISTPTTLLSCLNHLLNYPHSITTQDSRLLVQLARSEVRESLMGAWKARQKKTVVVVMLSQIVVVVGRLSLRHPHFTHTPLSHPTLTTYQSHFTHTPLSYPTLTTYQPHLTHTPLSHPTPTTHQSHLTHTPLSYPTTTGQQTQFTPTPHIHPTPTTNITIPTTTPSTTNTTTTNYNNNNNNSAKITNNTNNHINSDSNNNTRFNEKKQISRELVRLVKVEVKLVPLETQTLAVGKPRHTNKTLPLRKEGGEERMTRRGRMMMGVEIEKTQEKKEEGEITKEKKKERETGEGKMWKEEEEEREITKEKKKERETGEGKMWKKNQKGEEEEREITKQKREEREKGDKDNNEEVKDKREQNQRGMRVGVLTYHHLQSLLIPSFHPHHSSSQGKVLVLGPLVEVVVVREDEREVDEQEEEKREIEEEEKEEKDKLNLLPPPTKLPTPLPPMPRTPSLPHPHTPPPPPTPTTPPTPSRPPTPTTPSLPRPHTPTPTPTTPPTIAPHTQDYEVLSYIYFVDNRTPSFNNSEDWELACGRVEVTEEGITRGRTELRVCQVSAWAWRGGVSERAWMCRCHGPGLYTLLMIPRPHIQSEGVTVYVWWVGVVCIMAGATSMTGEMIQLLTHAHAHTPRPHPHPHPHPRPHPHQIQLRLLRSVYMLCFNMALAVLILCPGVEAVRGGVAGVGMVGVVVCVGVGVGQQLILHQHLTSVNTTIKPYTFTHGIILIIVVNGLGVGLVVWWLVHLSPPPPTPDPLSWLPLGDVWVMGVAGVGVGGVAAVWGAVTAHNLRVLVLLPTSTPPQTIIGLVWRRVYVLGVMGAMDCIVMITSFFLHQYICQLVFCIATLTQSFGWLVVYTCGGDSGDNGGVWCGDITSCNVTCCHSSSTSSIQQEGEDVEVKSRRRCCLGGFILPSPSPSPSSLHYVGGPRRGWEFRSRVGCLWSQTGSTVGSPEPLDTLPSPTELPGPPLNFPPVLEHRSPDPSTSRITPSKLLEPPLSLPPVSEHHPPKTSPTSRVTVRKPTTLCLKGSKFICGKNVTSPEDYPQIKLQLPYRDFPSSSSTGRQLTSRVLHQYARTHRGTHNKYLEMSVHRNTKQTLRRKSIFTKKSATGSNTPRKYINASGENIAGHHTKDSIFTTKKPESIPKSGL
ncbi:hypothetical protein Pmani_016747 [Petrolisthes manimaculis]|uniref:Uncharacterized protein n=1 Tax=Petrolisthes manimaculis TaxID=1843537 RepID=A0AAE1PNL5_9EUCA|nr:hypothetical protein Pmani_016747 [Petrolisthes manimaculis]